MQQFDARAWYNSQMQQFELSVEQLVKLAVGCSLYSHPGTCSGSCRMYFPVGTWALAWVKRLCMQLFICIDLIVLQSLHTVLHGIEPGNSRRFRMKFWWSRQFLMINFGEDMPILMKMRTAIY